MHSRSIHYKNFLFGIGGLLLIGLVLGVAARPAQGQSLYADPIARSAGDLITIVLAERTDAQRASGFQNSSDAALGGASSADGGNALSGRFALDASFSKSAKNRNQTVQSDLLQGTITARVVGVDSTGNLLVSGERKLNVNGVTHLMRVSGHVRPFDVRHNNTVLSYQVADALIEYRRAGMGRKFIKPGTFAKLGAVAVLAGALLFASQ